MSEYTVIQSFIVVALLIIGFIVGQLVILIGKKILPNKDKVGVYYFFAITYTCGNELYSTSGRIELFSDPEAVVAEAYKSLRARLSEDKHFREDTFQLHSLSLL